MWVSVHRRFRFVANQEWGGDRPRGEANFLLVRTPGVASTDCGPRLLLRKFFVEFTGEFVNVRSSTKRLNLML